MDEIVTLAIKNLEDRIVILEKKTANMEGESKRTGKRFVPPTAEEVQQFIDECKYTDINPFAFVAYYAARNWKLGNTKLKDWKAAIHNWHYRTLKTTPTPQKKEATGNFHIDNEIW